MGELNGVMYIVVNSIKKKIIGNVSDKEIIIEREINHERNSEEGRKQLVL